MTKRRDCTMQNEYIERMVKNLPVLRAAVGITQAQLGSKIGVSRQTIVAIENEKKTLSWSLYLAIVCVFEQYENTQNLLMSFQLFDSEYVRGTI